VTGWLERVREQAAGDGWPSLGMWAAVVVVVVIAVTGLVGIVLHQPWLFPSLGPTIMVILEGQPPGWPDEAPSERLAPWTTLLRWMTLPRRTPARS
jgi:hypothetical protein